MKDGPGVIRPHEASDGLYGIYVGRVVDNQDLDQRRFRVRVYVSGVHAGDEPIESLPWAEVAFAGASPSIGGSGDFRPYPVDSLVFVQFLGGSEYQPVVVGGCSATQLAPAVPMENEADYAKSLKRWTRRDSVGNTIVMSENADEQHVRIQSGGSEILVSAVGKGIVIKSLRGAVRIEGSTVEVASGQAIVRSNNVTVEAAGEDVLAQPTGKATLISNKVVDIGAFDPISPVPVPLRSTEVNIGGRIDEVAGIANPPPTGRPPQQTEKVNIRSQSINIGVGAQTNPSTDTDGLPPLPLLPTLTINIRSTMGIAIKTPGSVAVHATDASITAVMATISATASCSLKTLGPLTLEAAGLISILGTAALTVQAASLSFLTVPASPPIVLPPIP